MFTYFYTISSFPFFPTFLSSFFFTSLPFPLIYSFFYSINNNWFFLSSYSIWIYFSINSLHYSILSISSLCGCHNSAVSTLNKRYFFFKILFCPLNQSGDNLHNPNNLLSYSGIPSIKTGFLSPSSFIINFGSSINTLTNIPYSIASLIETSGTILYSNT